MMDLEAADFSWFPRNEQKAVVEDWLELTFDILDDEKVGNWELANLAEATGARQCLRNALLLLRG